MKIRDRRAATMLEHVPSSEIEVLGARARGAVDLRDPRAATMRQSMTSPTLPQVDEWNAEQAFRLGYCANVIAYRCVQLRANAIASVPLVAGRKMGDPTSIRPDAPISKLLGAPPYGPAPKLSISKLIRWTIAQEIVAGRRAWEIETDDGGPDGYPVAFWPLAAANLRAHPSRSGSEWFRLFEYGPSHAAVKFQPGNVFYGWDPGGVDFRQAEAELQAVRFDLSLVNLCDRYSIGFLRNNAVPAAIITTTQFPNEAAKLKFMANWRADFGGPDNAGRVALNEVGADGDGPVSDSIAVNVLGLSAKDARLVEQRKDAMVEVAVGLGTPWSKLDASGRTFDNAAQEDLDWWENTNLPQLIDLQDDINMQLAPRFGDEVVWFDLRGVRALQRRVQPITQTVGAPSLVQAQLMKINEARADYGLEPLEDGDRVMTAEEIAALRGSVGNGGAEAVRAALQELEERTKPADNDGQQRAGEPEQRTTAPRETRGPDPEQIEIRRTRIWRTADAVVRSFEARWQRAWRRMFARQQEAALARLTGKRGRQALGYGTDGLPLPERRDGDPAEGIDPGQIFDQAYWTEQTAEMAADLYDDVTTAGLNRLTAAFGVAFDVHDPDVADFIAARANQLAGPVTQTTYDAIRTQLIEGVGLGESIDDLAVRIRTVFTQASDVRAETIARTEVISAYNGSAVLGASQLPADVVAGQEWIATRDSRTRSAHAAVDGQIVAIGEPFTVAGGSMAYPGDPSAPAKQIVNCRCTVAFLTPDEMAEALERSSKRMPMRAAVALLAMVPTGGDEFDFITWRRAAEEVAA